ncbi:MAG: cytochrome b/b6 domain-containing protein [Parvibaculum sp.]|uniref:cytochrome b/b6 domain-containing protein n=1 Tax=Parvibaculum sp. TaxID=2024848 RepID=UPI0025F2D451|nr:cytochrome b/b6 domain-containing protein [Parvibaculum sp.]MCE9650628.1 cytochrome b/b6 domain-containing protein [Parvibaculum sp.]
MSESISTKTVRVWDPFVRIFHWTLVAGFAVAYLTEGEPFWLHITAGFIVAGLVAARILWGFVGPEYARFSNFIYKPSDVLSYLKGSFTGTSKRYLGHSPAGGAMVIALLLSLAGTTGTGAYMYFTGSPEGQESGEAKDSSGVSPFAVSQGEEQGEASESGERDEAGGTGERAENPLEEVHEFFANFTLLLVMLHIAGVALASFTHRENLPRAMVTGTKRK